MSPSAPPTLDKPSPNHSYNREIGPFAVSLLWVWGCLLMPLLTHLKGFSFLPIVLSVLAVWEQFIFKHGTKRTKARHDFSRAQYFEEMHYLIPFSVHLLPHYLELPQSLPTVLKWNVVSSICVLGTRKKTTRWRHGIISGHLKLLPSLKVVDKYALAPCNWSAMLALPIDLTNITWVALRSHLFAQVCVFSLEATTRAARTTFHCPLCSFHSSS